MHRNIMGTSIKALAAVGVTALCISPASAGLIVGGTTTVNASSAPTCSGLTAGPATTISGCLSSDHTIPTQFDSADENIIFHGGAAQIQPDSGLGLNDLKISLPGRKFTSLSLDIVAKDDGTVNFVDNFGHHLAGLLSGTGQNVFDLTGDAGEQFKSIKFTTSNTVFNIGTHKDPVFITAGDGTDVKQISFGGLCTIGVDCVGGGGGNSVPEPSTTALLGAGLLGFAFFGRLRRRASPQA